ncbi:MAG TPA: nucleotidyltransferase family protein, partial [Gemmatimonadaceae bacterium]|nr:nucleotidyltransferase family protein [Gemmatimonadaceae bacterium]
AILAPHQSAAADSGLKAMIPIGRPFLDYVLSALADAGFTGVCIVIGPEHGSVREYYNRIPRERLSIETAIQDKPLGTADAVLAAEKFAGNDSFAVLNSDNYYPPAALKKLREAQPPTIVAFSRRALIEFGNVRDDNVGRFGALDIDRDGFLRRIVREATPDEEIVYASMNCWTFTPDIFAACRKVPISPRGELELPKAVELAIAEMGMRMRAIKVAEPVLDMSSRGDVASVADRLRNVEVSL